MACKPEYVNAGYWWTEGSLPAINIKPNLFTHLFCAYADVDPTTYKVIISSKLVPISTFSAFAKLKDPKVKTVLSINAKQEIFSLMAGQSSRRRSFINSSISLARQHGFDGLDLHWLFPSKDTEMTNLSYLLNEWRNAIKCESQEHQKPPLLLVATVFYSPYPNSLLYPIEDMKTTLDWINMVAYDFYTPRSSPHKTGPASAFSNETTLSRCAEYGIQEWIRRQFPAKNIVLGLPFYGWAWLLQSPDKNGPFSPAYGPATENHFDISPDGLIDYGNITKFIEEFSAAEVYSKEYMVSYCYRSNDWISYDDEKSISAKISKAKALDLLGYFAWHIGGDDEYATLATIASQEWRTKRST